MAKGNLTRHFGAELVELLGARFQSLTPAFNLARFREVIPELDGETLMRRVRHIAEALDRCLPDDPADVWELMRRMLPSELTENQQIFNEGYWMLPLAAWWELFGCPVPHDRHARESSVVAGRVEMSDSSAGDTAADLELALHALAELTRRGTSEFAIRRYVNLYPKLLLRQVTVWACHPSFHVRRLASEGTRPYLPWGGKLRVGHEEQEAFLRAVTPLARDVSPYVRRSVGNHVRDWRRIDPAVADRWLDAVKPPEDVRRLAQARGSSAERPRGRD